MIWVASKKLGVGLSLGEYEGFHAYYCVSHYWPSGNVIGSFRQNVKRSQQENRKTTTDIMADENLTVNTAALPSKNDLDREKEELSNEMNGNQENILHFSETGANEESVTEMISNQSLATSKETKVVTNEAAVENQIAETKKISQLNENKDVDIVSTFLIKMNKLLSEKIEKNIIQVKNNLIKLVETKKLTEIMDFFINSFAQNEKENI